MRVVDHAQYAGFVAHRFQSAGHTTQLRETVGDGSRRKAVPKSDPNSREDVVHVEITDQRRNDLQIARRCAETHADSVGAELSLQHHHVRAALAPGKRQHWPAGFLAHGHAVRIVGEEDTDADLGKHQLAEQNGLCGKVPLHRAVVVEMVLRDVGQRSHAIAATGQTPLFESDGRRLHHHIAGA